VEALLGADLLAQESGPGVGRGLRLGAVGPVARAIAPGLPLGVQPRRQPCDELAEALQPRGVLLIHGTNSSKREKGARKPVAH
jgi:hypothetical protein